MNNKDDPVYIDPFDEGYLFAKQGCIDIKILALPIQKLLIGDQFTYNDREWQQFLEGARKALMENKE